MLGLGLTTIVILLLMIYTKMDTPSGDEKNKRDNGRMR
jgi:hypothetical protein